MHYKVFNHILQVNIKFKWPAQWSLFYYGYYCYYFSYLIQLYISRDLYDPILGMVGFNPDPTATFHVCFSIVAAGAIYVDC